MATNSPEKLYTPEILGLAVELAGAPFDPGMAFVGEARSQSCGSNLKISLDCHACGAISAVGMLVSACAIGQAGAALFARHVRGNDRASVIVSLEEIERWLSGESARPSWPDISILDTARGYPARHGAILLPWRAAAQALSNTERAR